MEIELDDSFPVDEKNDLTRVAKDVVEVVRAFIPGVPPQGERRIVCFRHGGNPVVVWPPRAAGVYHIGVNVKPGRYYFRFAYQLSHELGHVMFDPSRSNGALEILATAVSLQSLRAMEQLWSVRPPYAHWQPTAVKFRDYYDETDGEQLGALLEATRRLVADGDWNGVGAELRRQRAELDANPCDRPLNHLGARYLLARGIPWPEVVGLAAKTVPAVGPMSTFDGNASFAPGAIPAWLEPIWTST